MDYNFFKPRKRYVSLDEKYYEKKKKKQKELDELLDKINKRGINSLTKKEKQRLEELSN